MTHAIIGSGAIGIFYGSMLIKAGEDVHFLLHNDYDYVREHGLKINSAIRESFNLPTIQAYNNTKDMPPCDYVFVCLKTTQNQKLLPQLLPPLLKDDTVVVLIQNGLGVENDVAEMFPTAQIAGGLAFISCNKIGPGEIYHLAHGDLSIGNFNVKNREKLETLKTIFTSQQISCIFSEDLPMLRWRKLLWNIPFNGMTVVLNAQTDKLMANEALVNLSKQLMEEVILGARACGVNLDPQLPEQMIPYTKAMAAYSPSMKLDYDYKRPMEIHYIYENPVRTAKEAGYYMSKVDMLSQQLQFIQEQQDKEK